MIRVSNKVYSFVALLYVFLSLLGYQLVTTLLLPLSSDVDRLSSTVTYPYRAIVFVLSFFLIITSPYIVHKVNKSNIVTLYVGFMCVYLFRIFVDIYVRNIYIHPGWATTVVQYVVIVVLPAILAMLRCASYIDLARLNRWLLWGGIALLVLLVVNQNTLISFEYEDMQRAESNVAMGSLNLGYSCTLVFYIILSILVEKKHNWLWSALLICFLLVSFVIMLRAASRGPLVSWGLILVLFVYSRIKNKALATIVSITVVLLVWVNISSVLDFIGNISPYMERRMMASVVENDTSGRNFLFSSAIDLFSQNPVLGKQFVLPNGFYAHNSILDVMIGLGAFGAIVWVIIIINDFVLFIRNVFTKSSLMMISLISVNFIIEGFFSGAMYISARYVICLLIVFICSPSQRKTNEYE